MYVFKNILMTFLMLNGFICAASTELKLDWEDRVLFHPPKKRSDRSKKTPRTSNKNLFSTRLEDGTLLCNVNNLQPEHDDAEYTDIWNYLLKTPESKAKYALVKTDLGPELRIGAKAKGSPPIGFPHLHHLTLASDDFGTYSLPVYAAGVIYLLEQHPSSSKHPVLFITIESGGFEMNDLAPTEKTDLLKLLQEHVFTSFHSGLVYDTALVHRALETYSNQELVDRRFASVGLFLHF